MFKVHIQVTCSKCNGDAYLPVGEAEDCQGHKYTRHIPCSFCEGSGNEPKWIDVQDFAKLLHQALCPHKHTSYQGNMHFTAGDVWDDIQEVCDDCGANLDRLTLSDFIVDEK
jgi:DnaJ-class molecular chaperone